MSSSVPKSLAGKHVNVAMMTSGGKLVVLHFGRVGVVVRGQSDSEAHTFSLI